MSNNTDLNLNTTEILNKFGDLKNGYYKNEDSVYRINGLKFEEGRYWVTGSAVHGFRKDDVLHFETIQHCVISPDIEFVEATEDEYNDALRDVTSLFMSSYNEINSRSYLFKFEDNESRKYEQLLPFINNASKVNDFSLYFYYAPSKNTFAIVRINPCDIVVETAENGDTRVGSFKYSENRMTIDGNPFASNTLDIKLILDRDHSVFDSNDLLTFENASIYVISKWHYEKIREIIFR